MTKIQNNSKTLYYVDKKTGNYIKVNCTLNASTYEVKEFFSSIERMKLDSTITGNRILKETKTTCDLVKEYKKILTSDVIDFSGITNLYRKNQKNEAVALIPIMKFLDLFNKNVEEIHTSFDVYTSLRKSRNPLFSTDPYEKKKKELKSIIPNTEVLNAPVLKSITKTQKVLKENKNQTKIMVKQNKVSLAAS